MKFSFSKKLLFISLSLFLCIGIILFSLYVRTKQSRLDSRATGEQNPLVSGEGVVEEGNVIHFSLYETNGSLYETRLDGETGAQEFITTNPTYEVQETQSENPVQGVTTGPLLPSQFAKNSTLVRSFDTTDDQFYKERGLTLDTSHYFYNQTIQGIPVYGGILGVHMKEENKIYALDGSLVKNETLKGEKISEDTAIQKAKEQYILDTKTNKEIKHTEKGKYIFNKKLLGISEDSKNYLTLAVTIGQNASRISFPHQYFIDLETGNIIYTDALFHTGLERYIFDERQCNPITGLCPVTREEGEGPVGDPDVDNIYAYFGDIYNYYNNTYSRDSYDGSGSPLEAFVHMADRDVFPCPNAAWIGEINMIAVCDGLVTKDIITHEVTHAVTSATAQLIYQAQSGALDESLADIFANALDPDWTIGEDSSIGIIRYMDDPTRSPEGSQPDRLFSTNYYCPANGSTCDQTNDYCGVHRNNGVMNKAFYLMTNGGNFNGCTVEGIGSEKSHAIMYRALTTYFSPNTNYKAVYTLLLRACDDLYDSPTCTQVKNALQATELDQQPDFTQIGAKCSNVSQVTPQCAISPVTPTPIRIPTATPTPTSTPSPTPTPTRHPTPTPSPTPTVVPTSTPFPTPTMTQNGTPFSLTVKLHGIGNSGDNKNPLGGNKNPVNQQRLVTLELFTKNNTFVTKSFSSIKYFSEPNSSSSGTFKGIVNFDLLEPGDYQVRLSVPQYLPRRGLGVVQVTDGTLVEVPELTLVTGDVTADSKLDILDYNMLMDCYQDISPAKACTPEKQKITDLTDEGLVNQTDYNLLIRELSVQFGE